MRPPALSGHKTPIFLPLVKLLIKLELIDADASWEHLEASDLFPIAFFAEQGHYQEQDALNIVAAKLNIPLIELNRTNEEKALKLFETAPLSRIDYSRWRSLKALPVEVKDGVIQVAMANPLDTEGKAALEFDLGKSVKLALACEKNIVSVIERKLNSNTVFDLEELAGDTAEVSPVEQDFQESQVNSNDISAAPVVRIVNKIYLAAIQRGASDIHLNPEKDALIVRVRVDGILEQLFAVPDRVKNLVISRIKLLCGMDIAERRKPQDGRLRLKTGLGVKDLRISTVPTVYGENIVARVLSSELSNMTFESLGMPVPVIQQFKRALKKSSQLILVSGPTGSGKTSTLYSSVLHLRDGTSNIITIEDPIEYRFHGVNQIQVNAKSGVTFAEGLRSILRQDPDVIMLGEIRDQETAAMAMQVAQTGHLVLSTIHTNSAAAAITRLLDLGIPAYLIASSLGEVLAQRLVRRLCNACAHSIDQESTIKYQALGLSPEKMRMSRGCIECNNSGYRGRIGVYSLLEISDQVRQAIRDGLSEQEIEMYARERGYKTLNEAGLQLVQDGLTSYEEFEDNIGPLDQPSKSLFDNSTETDALAKRTILLVEDEDNTRRVIAMLLEDEMFHVVEARSGNEGLEKVYSHKPHLIVCDLMMPKMNGLEMVQRLRSDSRTRSIPILMLTAADNEDNELSSIGGGADDFVSKAAGAKVMMARVHRLLARAKSDI